MAGDMKMRRLSVATASVLAAGLIITAALAAGDVSAGKKLFNDPSFAGGKRACSQCHPGGSGLEDAAEKKKFHIAGGVQKSIEEAVNACIVYAADGTAIDVKSREMEDLVAYIRSLKKGL